MSCTALQRLRSLERLDSLDIAYVDVGTYSMRLHAVRLIELLYLPRLRRLRLVVPGLHDEADAASFLGANFMRQLREGCLQELDITLLSDDNGRLLRATQHCPNHTADSQSILLSDANGKMLSHAQVLSSCSTCASVTCAVINMADDEHHLDI